MESLNENSMVWPIAPMRNAVKFAQNMVLAKVYDTIDVFIDPAVDGQYFNTTQHSYSLS